MPESVRQLDGATLQGPKAAPLLVLAPSLGTSAAIWEAQIPRLVSWFRVLAVEHPGHGGAAAPDGEYSVERLGERILALVDGLGCHRFSFAGLSLGGMIGIWLGARHPERLDRLALCCTAPRFEPAEMWLERARNVRRDGTRPRRETLLARWFSAGFLAERPQLANRFYAEFEEVEDEPYARCCELLSRTDLSAELERVQAPTLVLAGALDGVVPPQSAVQTMAAVDGASLRVLAEASHLACVEQPQAFTDALIDHFTGGTVPRGRAAREAVLGDIPVNAAAPVSPPFNLAFDEFLAKTYWGEVWSRPGLETRTRRLLNIGMLIAINHLDGLEVHVRGALREGISVETLMEVLLQSAICVGVPAANSARFAINRIVAEESDRERP